MSAPVAAVKAQSAASVVEVQPPEPAKAKITGASGIAAIPPRPLPPVVAASQSKSVEAPPTNAAYAVPVSQALPAIQVNCPQSTSQPALLAITLLLIGGWLTHRLSARRELRKECRTEIDACCKLIADLLDKARKHYAVPGDSDEARKLAPELIFDFHRLTKRVERLQLRYKLSPIDTVLDAVSDSLTGDDFDSVDRPVYVRTSERVRMIEQDVHQLMDAMEDGFSHAFDRSDFAMVFDTVRARLRRH